MIVEINDFEDNIIINFKVVSRKKNLYGLVKFVAVFQCCQKIFFLSVKYLYL